MFSRKALAILAIVVVEVYLARAAAQLIGAAPVALLMITSAVAGSAIVRRQVPALLSEGARRLVDGEPSSEQVLVQRCLLGLAGVLIAVPGLLTSAIGLILLLPPIRVLAGERLRPLVAQSFPLGIAVPFSANRRSPRRRDAVDVDVVTDDIRKSARPELN